MHQEDKEMKTKDFYSASLLKALGYPLIRMERGNGDFMIFVFNDPEFTAEEILEQYWNGLVTVNAKALVDTIKDLKTRLHSQIRM